MTKQELAAVREDTRLHDDYIITSFMQCIWDEQGCYLLLCCTTGQWDTPRQTTFSLVPIKNVLGVFFY